MPWQAGFNSLFYALNPRYIPFVDPCTFIPQDFMHLELDGIMRYEFAYLVYSLIRVHNFFTLPQLNKAIQSFDWPKGHKVPPLRVNLLQGTKHGRPKSSTTSGLSASQQLHLALHRCIVPVPCCPRMMLPSACGPSPLPFRPATAHLLGICWSGSRPAGQPPMPPGMYIYNPLPPPRAAVWPLWGHSYHLKLLRPAQHGVRGWRTCATSRR
eukprot:scaffold9353_cov136-Isochrysis_galbana.AAC.2